MTVLGPNGALPRGQEKRRTVEAMFDRVAPTYERTNRVISLGLDRRWRDTAVVTLGLARGSRVLDLACGTGDFCRDLVDNGHRVVGMDVSAGMLAAAHTDAPLVRADAATLPSPDGAFDGLTCGFALRNFVELDVVLRESARVLRRGGRFVALDATVPTNPIMRIGNALWFRGAVPLLGRVLAGDAEAYRYLPKSTAYLPPPDSLASMLGAAGFADVDVQLLTGGSVLLVSGDALVTTTPASLTLVAEVREVEDPRDVLDVLDHFDPSGFAWLHDGTAIVTTGVAARVSVDAVGAALAGVVVEGANGVAGTGAIAVGALPFDPEAADAELVIPAFVVTHGARTFVTRIAHASAATTPATPPTRFVVDASRTPEQWRTMVERALSHIADHDVEKIVLAREVLVDGDAPFDIGAIVSRLTSQQPGSFVYASEGFVGASPELLVRRVGDVVESRPMAGTAVADGDTESLRALAESVKDQREHRFVVDAIADALRPVCRDLEIGAVPDVAVFGHVAHLATRFRGHLRTPAPTALELARLLHPTPAVGGTPTARAVELVRELEGFDRGRYAGPVGWVDAAGNGEWAIALRGAEIDGARARLVAGAGIVAGSDPDAEWAETQAKLEPMLRALVRP